MKSVQPLTDPGKLLIMFDVALERNILIDDNNVDSYVYLLRANGVQFGYSFVFHPLPYSEDLRRDLTGLQMAGYLARASITITPKGRGYVRQSILPEYDELLDRIRRYLQDFSLLDRTELFKAVYARIV